MKKSTAERITNKNMLHTARSQFVNQFGDPKAKRNFNKSTRETMSKESKSELKEKIEKYS